MIDKKDLRIKTVSHNTLSHWSSQGCRPITYYADNLKVQAMRYNGTETCAEDIVIWLLPSLTQHDRFISKWHLRVGHMILLPTTEGLKFAQAGDYVVYGALGEIFPMPEDQFNDIFSPTPPR